MPLLPTEIDDVMMLAWPLPAESRAEFVAAVEAALEAHAVHGPGLVHRLARQLQPAYFSPPPRKSTAPQFFNSRKHSR
jgi:hypothetical protein